MSSNSKEFLTENHCFTHYEIIRINCTWVIRYFLSCSNLIEEWKSPIFSSNVYEEYKFSLYIKRSTSNADWIEIFLLYSDPSEILEPKLKYKFSILNEKQEEKYGHTATIKADRKNTMQKIHSVKIINDLLCEDKLTICFEMSVAKFINITRLPLAMPKSELNKDLGMLFQNGKLTDFILVGNGKEFHVHKAILAARSEVFAAMFEHEMQENKLNRVEITDIDPEVIQEMLLFIYTGVVTKLYKMAKFLFVAADKYALEGLKEMCEKKLCEQLSIEIAAETLILADRLSAFELKEKAIKFINDNSSEVVKTEDWKNMQETHPYLIVEAYQRMANGK
ncbi:speckle-type POZ protein B-like [Lucilia sericata]|uniref:speckle-type POZ protein B-like n=1 Tax=Lucilia sericata TaxID=13632 RepID=UPI0018A7FE94|nr:speckle-type POZ protein B-like [Lucilia sericata]